MRHYAVEEGTGRRFFVRSTCDGAGCEAEIKPGPHVGESGWVNCGWDSGPGTERHRYEFCPDCAPTDAEWAGHIKQEQAYRERTAYIGWQERDLRRLRATGGS